jgi:hypothetical protein
MDRPTKIKVALEQMYNAACPTACGHSRGNKYESDAHHRRLYSAVCHRFGPVKKAGATGRTNGQATRSQSAQGLGGLQEQEQRWFRSHPRRWIPRSRRRSNGFADKKAILEEIDKFELSQYTLKDFETRPIGADAALVTYIAEYSGKFAGEPLQSKAAYGELWTKHGNEWKLLYVQETRVK